ncbi:MAG: YHS domain-containing protein [Devosiaceae bacterium]|nr:YHS domain-containing protein [Devosiaceae bacterium MH13]
MTKAPNSTAAVAPASLRLSDLSAGLPSGSQSLAAASFSRRSMLKVLAFGAVAGAATLAARPAKAVIYTGYIEGTAVGGYDAVAYHTEGSAIPGDASITLEHEGATWRFASTANRDAFVADPSRYAPEYGGHCAWAMAQGYLAQGDPEVWRIVDGRLFLNANQSINRRWLRDLDGFISEADANWPSFL